MSASAKPCKVSVVMTAYNHPEFIPEAIESVLSQHYSSVELIVVDDGSKDNIAEIVAPYGDALRYIRQDNTGLGPARDTGVQAAKGQYIAFCDSDDIHLPYRLSVHAALLDAYPRAAQVFSDLSMYQDGEISCASTLRERSLGVDERSLEEALTEEFSERTNLSSLGISAPEEVSQRPVYYGTIPSFIAARHVAWGGASMFRRSMLLSVGPHNPVLRHWEDWSIVSRISKRYPMVYWDAPVLLYRQHEGQQTKQAGDVGAKAYRDVVFSIWKSDPVFAANHPQLLSDMVARATLRNARYAAEAGDYSRGRQDIVQWIRHAPTDYRGYTALARNVLRDLLSRVPRQT